MSSDASGDGATDSAADGAANRAANTSPSGAPAGDELTDVTDVKEKFRLALERKRGGQAEREASGDRIGSSKVNEQRAAAKTKRTFRRKSG